MAELSIQVGCCSVQGRRPKNEDAFAVAPDGSLFVVADGMGGQQEGERASRLAVEVIARAARRCLDAQLDPPSVIRQALHEAHLAVLEAGKDQPTWSKMGTTAVVALRYDGQVWVAGVGDSPAYLVHADVVERLTIDHTIAEALARKGTITPEQAKNSPWRNKLYRFLGCQEMTDQADVHPFTPRPGDRLLLASDGLSGFVPDGDLAAGCVQCPDPQQWAEHLVRLALERGSGDNVTCIVVAFV